MGIVFRQSIKATIVTLTGAVLGAVTQYISAHVLLENELGIYRNLINQGVILQTILLMGSASVVYIYLQRYDDLDERRSVLITFSCLTPLVTLLLFSVPYFAFRHHIVTRFQTQDQPYIREFFAWMPVLGIALSFTNLLEVFLVSKMKTALAIFMREIVLRLAGLLLVLLLHWQWISFHYFVIFSLLLFFVPPVLLFFIARKEREFTFSLRYRLFSAKELRQVALFSWYHLLANVTTTLLTTLDASLLTPLSKNGSRDMAVYSFAQLLISILVIPYRALSMAAFPKINEAYVEKDQARLSDLFSRTTLNILIVSCVMFLLIAGNAHNAVAILPPGYAQLAPVLLVLCIGRIFDVATGLNGELINITPYYRFNFWSSLVLVAAIAILDRIFIPRYGIMGASWITTATLIAYNISKLVLLRHKIKIRTFSRGAFVILACGGLCFVLMSLLPRLHNPVLDTLMRSAFAITVFGLLILRLQPSPDVRAYLQSVRENKRLF